MPDYHLSSLHYTILEYALIYDWAIGDPVVEAEVNGTPIAVQLDRDGPAFRLYHRGAEINALVLSPRGAELTQHMIEREPPNLSKFLLSPMPGLLIRLSVSAGDEVKAGEELAAVEAMKMENSLRATDNATIAKILVSEGDSLEVDQAILEFE